MAWTKFAWVFIDDGTEKDKRNSLIPLLPKKSEMFFGISGFFVCKKITIDFFKVQA